MKKRLFSVIVAGLALVSAACQKLDEHKITSDSSKELTVTASIVNYDGTKVSYAFSNPENVKSGIKPSWVEGDKIFGFDESGNTFSFTVSSVDPDTGNATFDASSATGLSGTLYAVYYPGEHSFEGTGAEKTLAVDLSSQSGSLNGSTPVIMCATGTIDENNKVNFDFVNQTAIVGIYKMQVFNNGAPVVSKDVTGVKLNGAKTSGKIQVEGGVLTLVPGDEEDSGITATVSNLETDEEGFVNVDPDAIAPYFAVIPQDDASLSIEATCDGCTCKTNAAMTGKIVAGQYYYLGKKIYGGTVAKIDDTGYSTISEAISAATDGQTIKIENNCTVDKQILVEDKSIILDLNDKILTVNGTDRIYVMEDAGLTIKDGGQNQTGTIFQSATGSNVISLTHANSNLTIQGGKITCAEGQTAATVYVTDGTLSMTGGEITGAKVGISMTSDEGSTPEVIVSEKAKVTSTASNAISASAGTLTIDGGYFRCGEEVAVVYKSSTSTASVAIQGGCFCKNPSSALYADGYTSFNNPDEATKDEYPRLVKKYLATLTVGSTTTKYGTVASAVTAANGKSGVCTITLAASSTVDAAATVTNSAGVTLDLNGFTLTHDGSNRVGVKNSGKLTITDSKTGGTIIQTTAGSSTITYSSGSLTIAGGTITKAANSTYNTINVSGGTLTVTGGTISNNAAQTTDIITNRATIAVSNGTVFVSGGTITSDGGCAIVVSSDGVLNVSDGEIEAKSSVAGNAIYFGAGSTDISISGGVMRSKKATINITKSSQHKLTLSDDCTVISTGSNALYSNSTATDPNSTVTVTGGKFSTPDKAIFSVANTTTTKTVYSVSSCIFNGPDPAASRLASGCTIVDNDDPATKAAYPRKVVSQ